MRKTIFALAAGAAVVAGTVTAPAADAQTYPYLQIWYSSDYQGCTVKMTGNHPDLRKVHLTGSGLCPQYTADNETVSAKFVFITLNCHATLYTGYNYTGHSQNLAGGYASDPNVQYPNDYSSAKIVCS